MQPAMHMNIPVRMKNSYNPTHPGTAITSTRDVENDKPVTAISLKRGVTLVDIVSARVLGAYGFLAEHGFQGTSSSMLTCPKWPSVVHYGQSDSLHRDRTPAELVVTFQCNGQ
mmetsp:Transcript_11110/g.23865  ORF Transcript_11110/g.23865 Transcript_11110/m.23865 type:complete len:113 (+) Transcript_11110:795-1133(+)